MPPKPPEPPSSRPTRRFPWRLWLYAIVMTAGAGAGGYFTWQYRGQAKTASGNHQVCVKDLNKAKALSGDVEKDKKTCSDALGAATLKATELEKQNLEFTKNLNATQGELAQLRAQKAEADKRMAAVEDIRKQFAKMIDTGQLQVAARRGSLVVELPAEVLFPSGSSELSEDGKLKVLEVGFILKKFTDRRFLVVGHTDNVPLKGSTQQDNWQLSTARALTVTRVLVQAGMKHDALIPAGGGEYDPVAKNDSAQNRQRNRRIEIQLLPQLSELPPLPPSLDKTAAAAPTPPTAVTPVSAKP